MSQQQSSWFNPNYTNPEVAGHAMLPLGVFLIISSVIIVSLRFFTRGVLLHAIGIDDILMIPALLLAIADTITGIVSVKIGWGRHIWDIPSANFRTIFFNSWLNELFFTLSITALKLSLLTFYLRVAVAGQWFRRFTHIMIIYVICWCIAMITVILTQCMPITRYWNNGPNDFSGCLPANSINTVFIFHGISSTVSSIVIFLLPIHTVWRLQVPLAQKITLIGLFGMGAFAIIGDFFRAVYIIKTRRSKDAQTWEAYYLVIFSVLSLHISIWCASIPVCKHLFLKIFPALGSITNGTHTGTRSATNRSNKPNPSSQREVNMYGSNTELCDIPFEKQDIIVRRTSITVTAV